MTDHYTSQTLTSILSQWWNDAAVATVVPHLSSGLSGALIWRVTYQGQQFCLRRWPREHPSAEDLLAIHRLMRHVARHGIDFVPVPLGLTSADEHLWELAPWMPGEAYDRSRPNRERQLESMQRLAQFHVAARSYGVASVGPAPGLASRRDLLSDLQAGALERLRQANDAGPPSGWSAIFREMLPEMRRSLPVVLKRVELIADVSLPLQWCLRDVKHDHALFEGGRLVGLIDFGAAAIDSIAGDVARLLGSMIGDERAEWQPVIDAYHAVRPLSPDERRAIELFDQGGTLVASANWLRWLLFDERVFADPAAVRRQLEWLNTRLRALP